MSRLRIRRQSRLRPASERRWRSEKLPQSGGKLIVLCCLASQNLAGFHFIEKEDIDLIERKPEDLFIHRRRVQDDCHPKSVRFLHNIRKLVDLVLQDEVVPG